MHKTNMFTNAQQRFYICMFPHIWDIHTALHSKITNNLVLFVFFCSSWRISIKFTSTLYKGVVQITIDGGNKNVCWESLQNYWANHTVCCHLGYGQSYSLIVNVSAPTDAKYATFSGSINCNSRDKYLSQCSITASASQSCSGLSYIQCKCGKIKLTK